MIYDDGTDLRPLREVLSPRMLGITRSIVRGKSNREIAKEIGTTEQVVKNYTHRIFERTGCASRLELANRYAIENLTELQAEAGVVFGGAA